MALSLVSSISGVAAAPAWADGLDANIQTLVELEAGASFDSNDGWFTFSDFDFTAVGFDDSAFDQYLVQPQDRGFKLILGFGDLYGPGSLEMVYTVTTSMSHLIDSAAIPLIALFEGIGVDPLVEVEWDASNGATMSSSATGPPSYPFSGVSVTFDPTLSLIVEQIVTFSNGKGIVKVENQFTQVALPEPGSGLLVGLGLSFAAVLTIRRRSRTRRAPKRLGCGIAAGRSHGLAPGDRSSAR